MAWRIKPDGSEVWVEPMGTGATAVPLKDFDPPSRVLKEGYWQVRGNDGVEWGKAFAGTILMDLRLSTEWSNQYA